MTKYAGEEVLVVKRALLEKYGIFEGFRTDGVDDLVAAVLDEKTHFFLDRPLLHF
jgi:hypothetical protein